MESNSDFISFDKIINENIKNNTNIEVINIQVKSMNYYRSKMMYLLLIP